MKVYDALCNPHRCFLIAEIGSNHNGDFDTALRLMDVARQADADAVKFQSFLADQLVKPDSPDYPLLKRLELPQAWYTRLQVAARERGMIFFSTASNPLTLSWLQAAGVELFKIASPNLTHLPLIRQVAGLDRPAIMSTGMAGLLEIDEAVRAFTSTGNRQLALLHCTSEYPARPESLNLRAIPSLAAMYPFPVGFSDHSLDIGTAAAAVALGARIVEKHLTLGRNLSGPDHHYALEPPEFIAMARNIRVVERALGDGRKLPTLVEREKSAVYYRSLHLARDLPAGHVLRAEDLAVVRPNDGLHPRYFETVQGLPLRQATPAGSALTWKLLK